MRLSHAFLALPLLLLACDTQDDDTADTGDTDPVVDTDDTDDTDDTGEVESCESGEYFTRCDGDDVVLCADGEEEVIECPDTCGSDPDLDYWCQGTMPPRELEGGSYGGQTLERYFTWVILGDVEFDQLDLDAGAVLLVAPLSTVTVHDALHAMGTSEQPIRISSSADRPSAGDWERLVLGPGHQSRVEHTTIEHFRGIDSSGDLDVFDTVVRNVLVDGSVQGAVHQAATEEADRSVLRLVRTRVLDVEGGNGVNAEQWVDVVLEEVEVRRVSGQGMYLDGITASVSDAVVADAEIGLNSNYTELTVRGLDVSQVDLYGVRTYGAWGSLVDVAVTGGEDCFALFESERYLSTDLALDHVSCSGASHAAFDIHTPGGAFGEVASIAVSAHDVRDTPAFASVVGDVHLVVDAGNASTSTIFTADSDNEATNSFYSTGAWWNGATATEVEEAWDALMSGWDVECVVADVATAELSGVGAR